MYLMLYSRDDDPVRAAMFKNQSKLNRRYMEVSTRDILDHVEIFDEIIHGVAKLQWKKNSEVITNSDDVILINRAHDYTIHDFVDYHPDDREFACDEANAYLSFAIDAFVHKTASVNFFGLRGSDIPLLYQWKKISSLNSSVAVPDFHYGPLLHADERIKNCERKVFSNPYNYLHWQETASPDERYMGLVFIKPQGKPCFYLKIGDVTKVLTLDGEEVTTSDLTCKMTAAVDHLAAARKMLISETLFFVDGTNITFGAMTDHLTFFGKQPLFAQTITSGLEAWAKGLIHA